MHLGDVFPGADFHARLGVNQPVHFSTDAGNVVFYFFAVDVKVDASGIGCCHDKRIKNSLTPALSRGEAERAATIVYSSKMACSNGKGKDSINGNWGIGYIS